MISARKIIACKPAVKMNVVVRFTLIELLMAMIVVVFGMNAIISLISTGLDSTRDANDIGVASNAAEQFLRFNANKIESNWTWTKAFPDSKNSDLYDNGVGWSTKTWDDGTDMFHSVAENLNDLSNSNSSIRIYYTTNQINDTFDPLDPSHQSGVFLVQEKSSNDDVDEAQFSAILRAWKDYDPAEYSLNSGRITLYAEVSWPAEKPYHERKKEIFSKEIYKAPVNTVAESSLGAIAKTDGNGFTIQLTKVLQGSRIIEFTVVATDPINGNLQKMLISCDTFAVSEYEILSISNENKNFNDWSFGILTDPATGLPAIDAETGISGLELTLSDNPANLFEEGESFTITYKLEGDSVPETTIATVAEKIGVFAAEDEAPPATTTFTSAEFDEVYDYHHNQHLPSIAFTAKKSAISEDSTNPLTVEIELTIPPAVEGAAYTGTLTDDVTVEILTAGTATGETDYAVENAATTVTFEAGITSDDADADKRIQTISINPINDIEMEGHETIVLELGYLSTNGEVILGELTTHTATISDDDAATISFEEATSSKIESVENGVYKMKVEMTIPGDSEAVLTSDIIVNVFELSGGTARSDYDYNSQPVTVKFKMGDQSGETKNAKIQIANDYYFESDETFKFALEIVSGPAVKGSQTTHTATIIDDDEPEYQINSNGMGVKFGCDFVEVWNQLSPDPIYYVAVQHEGEPESQWYWYYSYLTEDQKTTLNESDISKVQLWVMDYNMYYGYYSWQTFDFIRDTQCEPDYENGNAVSSVFSAETTKSPGSGAISAPNGLTPNNFNDGTAEFSESNQADVNTNHYFLSLTGNDTTFADPENAINRVGAELSNRQTSRLGFAAPKRYRSGSKFRLVPTGFTGGSQVSSRPPTRFEEGMETATEYKKEGYGVAFRTDRIEVTNYKNWPVRQVVLWYLGEDDWESDSITVNIENDTSLTINADTGKLIQKVAVSRYTGNQNWTEFESDKLFFRDVNVSEDNEHGNKMALPHLR